MQGKLIFAESKDKYQFIQPLPRADIRDSIRRWTSCMMLANQLLNHRATAHTLLGSPTLEPFFLDAETHQRASCKDAAVQQLCLLFRS